MRLAFVADIQGNALAFEAVLAELDNIAIDHWICLGDVATGYEPFRVFDLLREYNFLTVRGNMDDVVLNPPICTGDDDIEQRYADMDTWCATQLRDFDRTYLANFGPHIMLDLPNGEQILACHGSPDNYDDVWTATTPNDEILDSYFQNFDVQWIAVGHMHRQLLRYVAHNFRLFNPGSVGWTLLNPATGRHPRRAEYAILETTVTQTTLGFAQANYSPTEFKARVLASQMPHNDWYLDQWE